MPKISKDVHSKILLELFPDRKPSRSEQRIFQIIEGAIKSYAVHGVEGTTFASIAKAAKTSRPLVQHYFSDKSELFLLVAKSIRIQMQQRVIQAMAKAKSIEDQFEAYLRSTLTWSEEVPEHAKVWGLVLYQSGVDKDARELNSQMALVGRKRIAAMIQQGVKEGVFQAPEPEEAAEMIQTLLSGALIVLGTENLIGNGKGFLNRVCDRCMDIARGK